MALRYYLVHPDNDGKDDILIGVASARTMFNFAMHDATPFGEIRTSHDWFIILVSCVRTENHDWRIVNDNGAERDTAFLLHIAACSRDDGDTVPSADVDVYGWPMSASDADLRCGQA